ncbi:hypothetical protein AUEXF2481DRAFT_697541 [Aureobasidium subglaciale EXF-2481]|uniref:Uncharacterized protein n=1 Tax=Aureobasidium subglaciale (strain EXF-2481) TaxID=1043005 RepID=A0A074YKR9_AURSE|nr:uncharacterized protein AUEXF2481DRAFT_697541 [Aureobasidium subglaciale EXF-2481]KAI5212578.1 hypothetical protein E4T38_00419 [Aureobasidium subglaciale]KAI5231600.1 hypothetical protein E4T40_00486 [Aureobasidium subglaciale]KAI5234311.1 hypothetical protein E4T41_00418 [Aureobasidium subglaciale]KAI5268001.1 hypothetical protein E4T46_00418 [Aureobasidium subglaciale]KEQ94677.1 hypothetical protein AUEXF2481DRAFT_697541 [Aureobasidium subglaciale EXF-2481]
MKDKDSVWNKPDPAAIKQLVEAHQLEAKQHGQASIVTSIPQVDKTEEIEAGLVNIPPSATTQAEVEQAQELPADVPAIPSDASEFAVLAVADIHEPALATSESTVVNAQENFPVKSAPKSGAFKDTPSSAQLLYAMGERQLSELKDSCPEEMQGPFQHLLGSADNLDMDADYQTWEATYRKETNKSTLDHPDDQVTLQEAQDALEKLQADKAAKKQMWIVLQMYARIEVKFLEDTRAKSADFGLRILALHDSFLQTEIELKERVNKFMDA